MTCNSFLKRPRKTGTLAAFALGFLLLAAATARAQTTNAGSITAINGTATITRAGASVPAAFGNVIQVGDTVTTGPSGRVTITLPDNTQLEVTESSTLVLTENVVTGGTRASTKVTLLGGLVRSLVRYTPGTPPNFEVHTPNAVAAARGTTYDTGYVTGVERKEHKHCREFTDVLVYDGTVQVSNPTNASAPPVDIHTGEKTTVPCGFGPLPASSAASAGAAGAGAAGIGGLSAGAIGASAGVVGVGGALGGVFASGAAGGGGGGGAAPAAGACTHNGSPCATSAQCCSLFCGPVSDRCNRRPVSP